MTINKHVLDNQLRVVVAPNPGVESMTALILIGAGSRYETKKNNGISHFLEHMVFKGTKKRPTAQEISSILDGIGGEYNAFTSKEYTGYYVKAASDNLDLVLDLITDMLRNSLFAPEEIEREKGVIIEEINMYEDMPQRHIGDVYEGLLYGDHPLGWDTAGRKEIIQAVTQKDFLDYKQQFYHPNNMVVALGGNVDEKKALESIGKLLSDLKPDKISGYKANSVDQSVPVIKLEYKKTDQAHLILGVRTFEQTSPKRYVSTVLNTILGGGMSSRLFVNVRERRGLAYYVRSSNDNYLDTGSLAAQAGAQLKSTQEVIKIMLEQFNDLKTHIEDAEIEKAKSHLKGRLALELEDTQNVAVTFGLQELLEKDLRTPEFIIDRINKVSKEEVQALAKEIFVPKNLNLAIIGPYKDESEFKSLLKL